MKKKIIALAVLVIVGLGVFLIIKAARPNPTIEGQPAGDVVTDTSSETGATAGQTSGSTKKKPASSSSSTTNTNTTTTSNTTTPTSQTLSGSYRLSGFSGVGFSASDPYTLKFEGKKISAKFCNSISGSYSISATGKITASQLATTLMFCETPQYLMDAEAAFSKILSEGAVATMDGTDLVLEGIGGERFIFDRQ